MQDFSGNTVRAAEVSAPSTVPVPGSQPTARPEQAGRAGVALTEICGRGERAPVVLPMLDLALDRVPDILGRRLSGAWNGRVTAAASGRRVARFDALEAELNGLRLVGRLRHAENPDFGLVVFPARSVWRLIDCMLGGSGGDLVDRQRFSHLERCLMRAPVDQLLAGLGEAFEPVAPIGFDFVGWAEGLDAARPGRIGDPVLMQELTITLPRGDARFDLLLPLSLFERHVEALAAPHPGERLGQDSLWKDSLLAEVRRATVEIEAVLYEGTAPVGRMRALQPGDSYAFGLPPQTLLRLRAGGVDLALGQLGRSGSLAAVRFETPVEATTEAGS